MLNKNERKMVYFQSKKNAKRSAASLSFLSQPKKIRENAKQNKQKFKGGSKEQWDLELAKSERGIGD